MLTLSIGKKADANNQKDASEDTYSSVVPPSPSTKSLLVYYSKSRGPFLANRYIIPTGSNRRKACFVREMYTYIHCTVTCITRYNLIDGKSLLAEIADPKLDQHAYPYINNTVGRKSINYPNIPYPKVPPHFSLFLFLALSLSPPDAAVLNLGQW